MKEQESILQRQCVRWFRHQYPQHALRLFAVPNGGHRHVAVAAKLKAEGALAGVSDLILLLPKVQQLKQVGGGNITNIIHHGLCIEMKAPKGTVQKSQHAFMDAAFEAGYHVAVVRDFETFEKLIKDYII